MLFRIVLESLARRRHRKLLSVLAVALGIAVTAAVATLALDVGDKVSPNCAPSAQTSPSRLRRTASPWRWAASTTGPRAPARFCRSPRS
ncbi:MAG: hypothetical protein LAO04_17985 [Acidobacteriia bacterium]|nr:hypothetical protein [Terriglobia bacterium]